ncbi:hypothetical protein N9V90_02020 [Endozoicomonas sp.]|nr:hypothetical protein [Endozoicomonas sp.]
MLITVLFAVWLGMPLPVNASTPCGNITIADTQSPSSTLLAYVDQFILTHAYGCRVSLIKGNNQSVIARMIQTGQPDIAPEIWLHPVKEAMEKAQKEQRLFPVGESIANGGEEGFWIPSYLVKDNSSLATLEGVKTHAALFSNPATPSRSLLYGCRSGSECNDTVDRLYKTLKLQAAGFDLFNSTTPESFDQSIEQAYSRKLPWIGYYHSPSTIMARFSMIKVDLGTSLVSEKTIDGCINNSQCPDREKSLYSISKIQTIISQDFAYRAVPAHNYLRHRQLNHQQLNSMLVWIHEKQAAPDEAARYFLMEHEKVWRPWLSFYAIGKVRRALNPR